MGRRNTLCIRGTHPGRRNRPRPGTPASALSRVHAWRRHPGDGCTVATAARSRRCRETRATVPREPRRRRSLAGSEPRATLPGQAPRPVARSPAQRSAPPRPSSARGAVPRAAATGCPAWPQGRSPLWWPREGTEDRRSRSPSRLSAPISVFVRERPYIRTSSMDPRNRSEDACECPPMPSAMNPFDQSSSPRQYAAETSLPSMYMR